MKPGLKNLSSGGPPYAAGEVLTTSERTRDDGLRSAHDPIHGSSLRDVCLPSARLIVLRALE